MAYYVAPYPLYVPQMQNIENITNAQQAVVTTTQPHGYLDGAIVRFVIPPDFGIPQINNMTSAIYILSETTFLTSIDTSSFYPFVVPMMPLLAPQVIPVGEIAGTLASSNFNRTGDAPRP